MHNKFENLLVIPEDEQQIYLAPSPQLSEAENKTKLLPPVAVSVDSFSRNSILSQARAAAQMNDIMRMSPGYAQNGGNGGGSMNPNSLY